MPRSRAMGVSAVFSGGGNLGRDRERRVSAATRAFPIVRGQSFSGLEINFAEVVGAMREVAVQQSAS